VLSRRSCVASGEILLGVGVPDRPWISISRPVVKYSVCGLEVRPLPETNVHNVPSYIMLP
jgi:hypothetical protein